MVMSVIWCGLLLTAVVCAAVTGNGEALAGAVPAGAEAGIKLALGIAGSLCLWTGVGKLMERAGVTALLSHFLAPLLYRLFPGAAGNPLLAQALSGNICANLLGLGNAATPLGIQAVRQMQEPQRPHLATDQMCRLIVLNTASIQLIPANVAAVRSALGSAAPFDILPAVWLTSLCSAGAGVCAAVMLGKLWRRD